MLLFGNRRKKLGKSREKIGLKPNMSQINEFSGGGREGGLKKCYVPIPINTIFKNTRPIFERGRGILQIPLIYDHLHNFKLILKKSCTPYMANIVIFQCARYCTVF